MRPVAKRRLDVAFRSNSDIIEKKSFALIDDLARELLANDRLRVRIEVHTDSMGSDRYNLELSQKRAEAIRLYLIRKNVIASRIEATGYGEAQPIDTNATAAGRANNRRITAYVEGGSAPRR